MAYSEFDLVTFGDYLLNEENKKQEVNKALNSLDIDNIRKRDIIWSQELRKEVSL